MHIGKKKVVLVVIAFKKHEIFFLKFENFNLKSGFKIDEVDPALGCRSYDFHSFFCILIFYKKKKKELNVIFANTSTTKNAKNLQHFYSYLIGIQNSL